MAMSATRVEVMLRGPEQPLKARALEVVAGIAGVGADDNDAAARQLLIRALHRRGALEAVAPVLDALARQFGLYPYVQAPLELGTAGRIAYELHRPLGAEDLVFHAEQAEVYRLLNDGQNVVLSAPTSFGKSLITDAVIASGWFATVAVVVPTIALIDETRRRLVLRFGHEYKIVTHPSQRAAEKTIYVVTQERLLQLPDEALERVGFFVIDEFYKLDMEEEEDRKCHLNQAFHRLLSTGAQFYLLGPRISSLAEGLPARLDFKFVRTEFETVVLDTEIREATPKDLFDQVVDVCRALSGPTLLYVSSPRRAHQLARVLLQAGVSAKPGDFLTNAGEWVDKSYDRNWLVGRALKSGIGVHHGRIPRALAHHIVRLFNGGHLPFLIATSTLIEGVNTVAANVVIVDNTRGRNKKLDYFTYSNICGRSGRMFRHFVGKVVAFHTPPAKKESAVDIPAVSQKAGTSPALLIQLPWSELTAESREYTAAVLRAGSCDNGDLQIGCGHRPCAHHGSCPAPTQRSDGMGRAACLDGNADL